MAAPTPATRQDPSGRMLGDGYRTLVSITSDRNIELWEVSVTPPSLEGDEPVDTSTMHNDRYRTKAPRGLVTLNDFTFTCNYDPVAYSSISAIINVATTITIYFPDGSSLCFYGFVRTFAPDSLEEGTVPTATVTIVPTNMDPTNCVEAAPVYTAGTGTSPTC